MLKNSTCAKDSFYKHCCHAQDSITAMPKIHSTRLLSYPRFIVQDYCPVKDLLYRITVMAKIHSTIARRA